MFVKRGSNPLGFPSLVISSQEQRGNRDDITPHNFVRAVQGGKSHFAHIGNGELFKGNEIVGVGGLSQREEGSQKGEDE